jgi:Zn-finger nucleic acid-binding protein
VHELAASEARERRRYNWCPACQELWVAARKDGVDVSRCPACDGPVLAYIGRSPYDTITTSNTDRVPSLRSR